VRIYLDEDKIVDDSVIRAMARWPDVPAVFGWLALDCRGRWLIKGELIANELAVAFINRNYQHDELGRWYFQNGPQRVYVELHDTPWIYRLGLEDSFVQNHVGESVTTITAAWMDEMGGVLFDTPDGVGRVDDRDLELLSCSLRGRAGETLDDDTLTERVDRLVAGGDSDLTVAIGGQLLPLNFVHTATISTRFDFACSPQADSGGRT
jgi:hypothetical protein